MAYKEFIVYSKTKAEFEALVSSNEVDSTQMGIIAETGEMWWQGEYRPIAETAPFAKDLTGVLEATPEEFTFRTSAGTKSIRDESAVIRRIKGNTSVWGQYIRNPIFAEGTSYWSYINTSISVDADGSLKVQHQTDSSQGISQSFATPIPSGHKVLVVVDYKRSSAATGRCMAYLKRETASGYDIGRIDFSSSERRVDAFIITTTDRAVLINVYPFHTGPVDAYSNVYSVNIFDLTQIFGDSNEPTTLEEFKRLYPDSYYDYCAPEVRSMRATGIETIGDNAFNGSYAEVIGGEQYYLNGVYTSIGFSKTIGGEPTAITIPNNKIYTPSERGYIRATGTDISIQLVHSGIRNGEYHDYWESERKLPDIAKYFPNGMHGIGDVYDEINEEIAIKRFGVRAYEEGDDDNADVMTDGTNTVYVLPLPIVTPITEPLQLDYKVADFGTEKMLSDLPSSPFRADIVYQFNAEGRIRDNARNIERLEEHTKNMATMEDVINAIPTEVATATRIEEYNVTDGSQQLYPNIMYEYSRGGISHTGEFAMPNIVQAANSPYDNRWMLRIPSIATSEVLTFNNYTTPPIKWKDGIAPTFTNACTLEIYLKKIDTGEIIGEWKIYR